MFIFLCCLYILTIIKCQTDLEIGVRRWDKDGDGFVNPQDLGDYMPDPPTPQQLEKFDFNHDGLYSIDELAVALGFQPWPKGTVEKTKHMYHSLWLRDYVLIHLKMFVINKYIAYSC